MRTQIEIDNVNIAPQTFLKWLCKNPDRNSYLKCKLKDIVIEVDEMNFDRINWKGW